VGGERGERGDVWEGGAAGGDESDVYTVVGDGGADFVGVTWE